MYEDLVAVKNDKFWNIRIIDDEVFILNDKKTMWQTFTEEDYEIYMNEEVAEFIIDEYKKLVTDKSRRILKTLKKECGGFKDKEDLQNILNKVLETAYGKEESRTKYKIIYEE